MALPIACNSSLKLYKSKEGDSFIYQCGKTYYEYRLLYLPSEQSDNDKSHSGYKVKDFLNSFVLFDTKRICELLPTVDFEWCYKEQLRIYEESFYDYYDCSLSELRCSFDTYFEMDLEPCEFTDNCNGLDFDRLISVIKAVYFFDDAAKALHEYRRGIFEITQKDHFYHFCPAGYILVAENRINKKIFNMFADMF